MTKKKIILPVLLLAVFLCTMQTANAQGKAYDKIVRHLQQDYQAKKVKIPFMWLAKIAVKVVKPAGVKSFNVTLFENLTFSRATLDQEMQSAMKDSLGPNWSPIIRIRSHEGEQVYMYMRDEGENVRLMMVTISKENATVIRAKFNADKFIEFLNNPKVMGISLGSDKKEEPKPEETKPTENRK
jgi:hypothetical protein